MSRSEELIAQYAEVHRRKLYGRSSEILVGYVQKQLDFLPPVRTILDYGCGRSRAVDWLGRINDAQVFRYDPALPEFAEMPCESVDLVLCTDVLEHIPEEDIDPLLTRIRGLSQNAYFNISCVDAVEILPNGENAHCTVRQPGWWERRLRRVFPDVRRTRSHDKRCASFVTWPEA